MYGELPTRAGVDQSRSIQPKRREKMIRILKPYVEDKSYIIVGWILISEY